MNMNIPDPQLARLPGHREGLEGAARVNVQEKGVRAWAVPIHTPPWQPEGGLRIDAPPEKSHCHHIPLRPLSQPG